MSNWSWSATSYTFYLSVNSSAPLPAVILHFRNYSSHQFCATTRRVIPPQLSCSFSVPRYSPPCQVTSNIRTIDSTCVVMDTNKALLIIMSCCLLICFILIYSLFHSKNFYAAVKNFFNWQSLNYYTSLDQVAPGGSNSTRLYSNVVRCFGCERHCTVKPNSGLGSP